MMEFIGKIRRFFTQTLWETRTEELPLKKRILLKPLKIILLSVRGFKEDDSAVRASALTLFSLLSIVPVTALLFGIAKGFGLEARLEAWLLTQLSERGDVMQRMVQFAQGALDSAQGGLVAGTGVVFLLFSVIKVINHIELAFNNIWSISKPRSIGRKLSDYLSLILVGPFLILGSSSLNIYLATLVRQATEAAPLSNLLSPLARLGLSAIPFLMLWLLFSFIFAFLPNTKVRLVSAAIGGAVTAFLYQLVQTLYINLQVGVTNANAIYGSFAALPLFIIWMQISWHIVLMGGEITHQHQNFKANEKEEHTQNLSIRAVKRLVLVVTDYVANRFLRGEKPTTKEEMGDELRIPSRVLSDILRRLVTAGILSEVVKTEVEDPVYQPARDPHLLSPEEILDALEKSGEDVEAAGKSEAYSDLLESFHQSALDHPKNRTLG